MHPSKIFDNYIIMDRKQKYELKYRMMFKPTRMMFVKKIENIQLHEVEQEKNLFQTENKNWI